MRKDAKNNEEALRILEALSAVDEELLARCDAEADAEGEAAVIPLWRRWHMWAACLSFIAVGVLSWNALRLVGSPKGSGGNADSARENAAPAGMAALQEPQTVEDANDEGAITEKAEKSAETELETGGGSDGMTIDLAESILGEEKRGEETQRAEQFVEERSYCLKDDSKEVTEEEARNWMPLGARIPQNLPSGYVFESARINEQEQYVTVFWSRGMDSIMITVSQVEADAIDTVDISKPETYDERLYEIPYGETVPKEYFQIFQDPVFDVQNISYDAGLELVKSRMLSYDDAGDTDTPRGTFSVLYSDGVLLRFNGRGTPEEIWNMLYSMAR